MNSKDPVLRPSKDPLLRPTNAFEVEQVFEKDNSCPSKNVRSKYYQLANTAKEKASHSRIPLTWTSKMGRKY